jgi:hypothetical protein
MTVDEARQALVMLGYPTDASPEPGKFGPVMRQSLMDFQKSAAIADHGMLDEVTQKKLEEAILGKPKPSGIKTEDVVKYTLIGLGVLGAAGLLYTMMSKKKAAPMSEAPYGVRYRAFEPEPERPYFTPPELPPPSRMTPVPPAVRFGVA